MPPEGPDAGRWHSVWVECDPRPPVTTVEAGYVLVDEARLLFTEPSVLARPAAVERSASGFVACAPPGPD
jgi:hypothetical protein